MRVAINLLTDHPDDPSGAHWFWTRVIPEMAARLRPDEEISLMVSPRSRPGHSGYGDRVRYITFPWSNERPRLRTLTEHLYTPVRLPLSRIDVLNTLIAPVVKPTPGLVAHFKTMHAFTQPHAINPLVRKYRQLSYPKTARTADAIIINSESLRAEMHRYLDVDPAKLHLIPEAVDHELFRPGDADTAREVIRERHGVARPYVLFVSSLWPYKNCDGALSAFAIAKKQLSGFQLVVVGPGRDAEYLASLRRTATRLGIEDDVVWLGGLPLEETAVFYRAAAALVYPSFNETFGLPILEAMASGCPVVTSNLSAMPETAGGAALLADPHDPSSIASALVDACTDSAVLLRKLGIARAAEFSWSATAERTLDVYRSVYARTGRARG